MMRFSRPIGLLTVASVLAVPALAAPQDGEAQALFEEGLRALEQNDRDAATRAFQQVLALDISREDAYHLWKGQEDDVWLELMMQQGQIELAAQRILELARAGRGEVQNDPAAIREMLTQLVQNADDVIARREIAANLASKHGEFVVPAMLPALADAGGDERRILFMRALDDMGHVVVLPLVEALSSPEPRLRRHAAIALGRVGDARATGSLMHLANGDADTQVRLAAEQALSGIPGATAVGNAAEELTNEGLDYALERESVMGPYGRSTVVWRWDGETVVGVETHPAFYGVEMAKRRLARAMEADPAYAGARAAMALAGAKGAIKLESIEAAGGDVGDMRSRVEHGLLQAMVTGPAALDGALRTALENGDEAAAVGLLRALSESGTTVGNGVAAALQSGELRVRGEAALAIAHTALRGEAPDAMADVVNTLGECAGQEVLRQAILIDSNLNRARAIGERLQSSFDLTVAPASSGVAGLRLILDVASADLVLVGSDLDDLTADRIIQQVERRPALEGASIVLLTEDADLAERFGDRIDGAVTRMDDLDATIPPLLEGRLTRGQATANDLAARACAAIGALASAGAADSLTSTAGPLAVAAGRSSDDVAIPALDALAVVGGAEAVAPAIEVATAAGRSDAVRIAAADCLAAVFRRGSGPGASFGDLANVLTSDASIEVRAAVARAIGALDDQPGGELSRQLLGQLDPVASE